MQTRIVPRSNPRSHETAAGLFKSSMYRWDEICKANAAALRLRDLVCWSCSTATLSLSLSLSLSFPLSHTHKGVQTAHCDCGIQCRFQVMCDTGTDSTLHSNAAVVLRATVAFCVSVILG